MASAATITIRYFAAFREAMGVAEILVALPDGVGNISGLVSWIVAEHPHAAACLADRARVHIAVNNVLASADSAITAGDVVDVFPPVSGG